MELLFLALLVLLMVSALMSGFPVGFALPGSAIASIAIAALCGWLFAGDTGAYFAQGGPIEWLSAGVTNFRSLYWEVERDTLIAIPLFVFMGIMLQRSRIAEDLLVAMAQLFGPIPGGLGISVVFVGALLAATTGIVGATVIAMGLISLPAMLRNNYSKPLAAGTICASGTLGQIIPPSVVLIILADQLASAADIAGTTRKAEYREATGEITMPSEFDVVSASAGDMFMGAFIPGLILVGIYMIYILAQALIRPSTAPPVPYEGKFDWSFGLRVLLALVPPLTLIFAVLGSILTGIATVNQAGAIGAIGALIMGGYRLGAGQRNAFVPAIITVLSLAELLVVLSYYDINIKNITGAQDVQGIVLASIGTAGLLVAILWSLWRAYRIEETLKGVMLETAKTTSMVFIILLGAAMLTSAFRAFGGEDLVREHLTSLPGGFWTQFVVVMAVIFFLGFFLDFIEIAVVVVPIVAPILLADPSANITAVWLGVMIGINIQTSFLTPPFGFALFYLRGVAPAVVETLHIYRGVAVFIFLQLIGLAIAGVFPSLVNYLPNRVYLGSETAPPPMNPKLQHCLEGHVFAYYDENGGELRAAIDRATGLDTSYLPADLGDRLGKSFAEARSSLELAGEIRAADAAVDAYLPEYQPLHVDVRRKQADLRKLDGKLERLVQEHSWLTRNENATDADLASMDRRIAEAETRRAAIAQAIPDTWDGARARYVELADVQTKARRKYRQNADSAFTTVADFQALVEDAAALEGFGPALRELESVLATKSPDEAMDAIKQTSRDIGQVAGSSGIKSRLSKARRALRGGSPDREKAAAFLAEARALHAEGVAWRTRAAEDLLPGLDEYAAAIRYSIGLRVQERLRKDQVPEISACQSFHRDVSLSF